MKVGRLVGGRDTPFEFLRLIDWGHGLVKKGQRQVPPVCIANCNNGRRYDFLFAFCYSSRSRRVEEHARGDV